MGGIGGIGRVISRFVKQFIREERANVAMIFALSFVALVTATGAGIDLSRALVAKSRLASALDAAALAVGASPGLNLSDMTTLANQYFDANYPTTALGTHAAVQVVHDPSSTVTTLSVTGSIPTTLLQLVQINKFDLAVDNEVKYNSVNLEVALALDTTGSMAGQKIIDLKAAAKDLIDLVVQDVQTPTYSKLAIIPYSMGVNVGGYATQVRGAIAAGKAITDASWATGTAKAITGATKTSPVVVTSNAHGFSDGDRVYIQSVNGMTQINTKQFTVVNKTPNTFQLSGVNGMGYSTYTSGGTVTKCQTSACEVVITANNHAYANGATVYITGVGGMTQINNKTFTTAGVSANKFTLSGFAGPPPATTPYTNGGTAYCTLPGCQYLYFTNAASPSAQKLFQVSTCVTERTGAEAYTDTAPSTVPLGRNYPNSQVPGSGNPCISATITPLSADKVALKADVNNLSAGGSTGGHIGVAWAWYMLSPEFGYLWPGASQPSAYDTADHLKVAVIMTDGEYNSMYCNGVIAQDSTTGSGSPVDHINCNAPNGHAFNQAQAQCAAMKAAGVIVYTVGFQVVADQRAQDLVNFCATDSSHVYLPSTGTELKDAFHAIAQDISALRLSK